MSRFRFLKKSLVNCDKFNLQCTILTSALPCEETSHDFPRKTWSPGIGDLPVAPGMRYTAHTHLYSMLRLNQIILSSEHQYER